MKNKQTPMRTGIKRVTIAQPKEGTPGPFIPMLEARQMATAAYKRGRHMNAMFAGNEGSGALGAGDRGAWSSIPTNTGNPYDSQDYVYRWRQFVHLYEISWEARKIIRIPVEDALRKPWEVAGLPEEMESVLRKKLDDLQFGRILERSLMMERLLGGCLTFLGLGSDTDEPGKKHDIKMGSPVYWANAIPISRISRLSWDTDPLSGGYMRPSNFLINGQDVHVSRCLVWDGDPLYDPYDFALTNFRSNLAGFGPSVLTPIWDDIVRTTGTRQAAYQLIQTNNALVIALKGLQDLMSTTPGQATVQTAKDVADMLSVYRAAIVDADVYQDMKNMPASFGSVPELLLVYLQVLSAASDIPATRFLGQAPGGLNATGESDLENYYNVIDAFQHNRIVPQLKRVYDFLGYWMFPQQWDKVREDLEIKFPPMWNANEKEEADTATVWLDNLIKLYEAGKISDKKFIEEINARELLSVKLDETDLQNLEDAGLGDEEIDPEDAVNKLRQQGQEKKTFDMGRSPGNDGPSQPGGTSSALLGRAPEGLAHFKNTPAGQTKVFTVLQAQELGNQLHVDWGQIPLGEFHKGLNVELEHADITKGDPILTANIALAHIRERKDYYTRLELFVENKGPFEEDKHPRDKSGEFTAGSGSSGGADGSGDKKETGKPKKAETDKMATTPPKAKPAPKKKKSDEEKAAAAEQKKVKQEQAWKDLMATKSEEDRAAFEETRQRGLKIPPAWTGVWVNPDKNADLQVKGKDTKGRTQYVYSVTAQNKNKAEKFNRLRAFHDALPRIMDNIEKDESDESKVLYLISKTGFRIGGEGDTGADVRAYGASTLRGTHVKIEEGKAVFDFIGKKGVHQRHVVSDPKIVAMVKDKAGKDEPLFNTSAEKVRNKLHSFDNRFKVKDFRTYVATQEALKAVETIPPPPPKTEKELASRILQVAKVVAQKLGNTPVMARDSYIDPTVWDRWRAA